MEKLNRYFVRRALALVAATATLLMPADAQSAIIQVAGVSSGNGFTDVEHFRDVPFGFIDATSESEFRCLSSEIKPFPAGKVGGGADHSRRRSAIAAPAITATVESGCRLA